VIAPGPSRDFPLPAPTSTIRAKVITRRVLDHGARRGRGARGVLVDTEGKARGPRRYRYLYVMFICSYDT